MKKKNLFSLLLCILLLLPCTVSAFAASFQDVPTNAWYAESVQFVLENGIMGGVGNNQFDPEGIVTRGMLVTILHRMEGTPAVSGSSTFQDVPKDAYYEKAVIWAAKNGLVNGYSTTQFGPNDSITREQFAAILYRYCSYKHGDTSTKGKLTQYKDAREISSYAKTAMLWANANGLITGTSATTLLPKGTANRAQAATIIMRYQTMMAPDTSLAGQFPVTPSKATTLSVGSVSAKAGEKNIAVDVKIQNNPGILGMAFTVAYDETELTLTNVENGDAVKDALSFMAPGKLKSQCRFIWYAEEIDAKDVSDGTILTMYFRISDKASGTYPISIHAMEDDVFDNDLKTVFVEVQDGGIKVS